jgi:hypothetical protein
MTDSELEPDFPLFWKGRRLASDHPQKAAFDKIDAATLLPQTLFVIPSPLAGWGVSRLVEKLPPDSTILLFEADPDLREISRRFWTWKESRIEELASLEPADWESFVRNFAWDRTRRVVLLPLNGGWLLAPSVYRDLENRLLALVTQAWSNRITCVQMGALWMRHLLVNLKAPRWVWPDWGADPVLVCGAGPSLERVLRQDPAFVQSRFRLLAADTAAGPLSQAGFRPDAIVILEAQHQNLADLAGFSGSGIPIFADLTTDPCATRITQGPIAWFSTQFAELSIFERLRTRGLFEDVHRFPALGSVGVATAQVAWVLTRGPVVFSGLDFSFPPGQTHVRGAPGFVTFWANATRLWGSDPPGSGRREGVHTSENSAWLTTGVLEGYARFLAESALKARERTFFWGPSPSRLGVQELLSNEWTSLIRPKEDSAWEKSSDFSELFQTWRQEELDRVDDFLRALESQDPLGFYGEQAFKELVLRLDHLSFSFPDPHYRPTSDWLSRLKAAAVWWRHKLIVVA